MVNCSNCGSNNLSYVALLHLAECDDCGVCIWDEDILQALKYSTVTPLSEEKIPLMSQPQTYGLLKTETPFAEIFPDRVVPLVSAEAVEIPNQLKAPPCFVVDAKKLSPLQIAQLAKLVFRVWGSRCQNLADAENYVKTGLPLKTDWFLSVDANRSKVADQQPTYN
jgi:hypothetical protein